MTALASNLLFISSAPEEHILRHHHLYLLKHTSICTVFASPRFNGRTSVAMAAKSPVVLILGAGPNISQAVARFFLVQGIQGCTRFAIPEKADSTDQQLNISCDLGAERQRGQSVRKGEGGIWSTTQFCCLPWQFRDLHPSRQSILPLVTRLSSRHGSQS